MNDLKQLEKWKEQLRVLEEQKSQYIAEHCRSSDGDGDWVEFEENDEYCIDLNEQIEELQNNIDNMEDYLREKYASLGEE